MDNLAPISISTYNRYEHLQKTVAALQQNFLARDSVLYIFSDAPKNGDEEDVAKVRKYMDSISGFKEIILIHQETNNYVKNMRESNEIPLNKFGKVIRMEDDIVTSPFFLTYMNQALHLYKKNKKIFAVCGYIPDVKLKNMLDKDVFLSKDFNAWGVGLWADRGFLEARVKIDYYQDLIKDRNKTDFINSLHPIMMDMLHLISQGKANPGDYKLSANLYLHDLFTVKPVKSLVQNIGFDGSGDGKAILNRFDTKIDKVYNPILSENLEYDYVIDKIIFNKYFSERLLARVMIKLKNKIKIYTSTKVYNWVKRCIKKYI